MSPVPMFITIDYIPYLSYTNTRAPSILQTLSYLIFRKTMWGMYGLHFTNEEIKTLRWSYFPKFTQPVSDEVESCTRIIWWQCDLKLWTVVHRTFWSSTFFPFVQWTILNFQWKQWQSHWTFKMLSSGQLKNWNTHKSQGTTHFILQNNLCFYWALG